jgi:ribosomal protein S27AE
MIVMSEGDALSDTAGDVPRQCPRCGAARVKRLVYGLVDYEQFLELGDSEPDFALGWLKEPRHDWRCGACGHEWSVPR